MTKALRHVGVALHDLTLVAAASGIRDKLFSAEELTVACLERIEQFDANILAWAWLDPGLAVAKARNADQLLRDGATLGPLHGVPIGIKDIIYTKDMPTRMGSPIFENFVPAYSATCVERLESAGAFVLGKTVTTEFATQHPGKTRNPWNPSFSPGGSSSGSAAAVSAGFVAGALGSQTRGSTIRPAAYCGVVGFKPSFGLVSRFGVHPLSSTLDHVGVLTRSIDDAGVLIECMSGRDERDSGTVADECLPRGLHDLPSLSSPPRLAAVRSPVWKRAGTSQQELFDANCRSLRNCGAQVDEIELPPLFDSAVDIVAIIQLSEIAHYFRTLVAESPALMSAQFIQYYQAGLGQTAADYLDALNKRKEMQRALGEFLEGYDAIITPPATGEAPRTLAFTGDASFCAIWTLCGVPSAVIPTGTGPNGLPMGLQVIGAHLNDRHALRVAKWCTRNLPFVDRSGNTLSGGPHLSSGTP